MKESGNAGCVGDEYALVKRLYPEKTEEPFYGPGEYGPLLESFGKVLLRVDDEYYTGDSRVLLKRGRRYGVLIFGWGSCSGCDALQGCTTFKELEELRLELAGGIRWMGRAAVLRYLATHDWEGDFSGRDRGETKRFVGEATRILQGLPAGVKGKAPIWR